MTTHDRSPESPAIATALARYFPMPKWEAPPDVMDFMHLHGSVPGALLYACLFVPEFQIVEGHVIFDDGYKPEKFRQALRTSKTLMPKLKDSFNWYEVAYLFANHLCQDDMDDDLLLAQVIAEAWRGRFLRLFPERSFVVEILSPEETGSVTGIGFREVTKEA